MKNTATFDAQKSFQEKFHSDAELIKLYPEENKRRELAQKVSEARNAEATGWPEPFYFKFITPGLISYKDTPTINGIIYMQKPALDAMMKSFEGKAIVNYVHRNVTEENYQDIWDGMITDVDYNAADGWYYARGFVWDDETKKTCRDPQFTNSCAFTLDQLTGPGENNKIKYEGELVAGTYTHLAIVSNPRIEGARNFEGAQTPSVAHNSESKEKPSMLTKLWKSLKEKIEAKNSTDVDMEKKHRVINGEKVTLKNLVDTYRSEKDEEKKKADVEAARADEVGEDEIIDIDGEGRSIKDLVSAYEGRAARMAKNAADEETKKKEEAQNALKTAHEKGEHATATAECAVCAEATKKEAQNALHIESLEKDHKEGKHTATTENCKPCIEAKNSADKVEAQNAFTLAHKENKHTEFTKECDLCLKAGAEAFNALQKANEKKGDAVLPINHLPLTRREKAEEAQKYHGSTI